MSNKKKNDNFLKEKKEINIKKEFFNDNNIQGLSYSEVNAKKKEQKINNFKSESKEINKNIRDIIFSNLLTPLNFLILIISIIIISIKRYEQLFFLIINSLNLIIGIFQEIKAKKALDKISLLNSKNTKVIRNGKIYSIPINDILVGDILFLELGSQIIADAKLKKGILEVNESLLTGESKTVLKQEKDILYSGSFVVSGSAYAEIISIGSDTYVSNLTKKAKKYKKIRTPLTEIFYNLIFIITLLILPLSIFLFFSSYKIYKIEKNEILLGLCGFILGMMPSGLFLLTSITLAIGFIKLANKKAYVKDLFGIEMLARIEYLCLDKTGTITNGQMKVKKILEYNKDFLSKDLLSIIISSFPNNNPTQNALYNKFSLKKKYNQTSYKVNEIQHFSSLRKYSAIEIDKIGTFLIGSPEFILKKKIKEIEKDINKNAFLGYRVLLLAKTDLSIKEINSNNKNNNDYKIIALIILEDQIKPDIIDNVKYFKENGVKIKIISGDNPLTIGCIAKKIGIIKNQNEVFDLSNLDNKKFNDISLKYNVFGRSSPEQKKNIIANLKKNGKKVAMIGDGVNDILAFKESDISIAMASGNEATQNVANLVLIDSQFSSLPNIVFEGRRVINNLKKISVLFLTKTILAFLLGIITIIYNFLSDHKLPFPLNPLQLNLIDIFFIGIPSFFLALEKNINKIEKNFLKNILKNSFPFAFFISLNYLLLLFFIRYPFMKYIFISNMLTIIASLFFLIVLIKSCLPFNKLKTILTFLMFLFFIIFSYFLVFKNVFKKEKNYFIYLFNQKINFFYSLFIANLFLFFIIFLFLFKKNNKRIIE